MAHGNPRKTRPFASLFKSHCIAVPFLSVAALLWVTPARAQTSGDFTGSISPTSESISSGGAATYTISLEPLLGFTGNVALTITGVPTGATAVFSPSTIVGASGSSTLTVTTTASTPSGTYTLGVTGTSGSIVHGASVTLAVNTSGGDFTGSVTPQSQSVASGGSASYTITLSPLYGFTGNVTLAASGLPTGATPTFSPGTVTGGSGNSTLTITTSSTTPTGTYTITITGTSGPIVHSTSVTLGVNTSTGDFTGSITPSSQTVALDEAQSAAYTIELEPLSGFTGNVALSASGVPAGATAVFSPSTITGATGSSTLTITPSASTLAGTYTITVSGTSGSLLHSASVTFVVTPSTAAWYNAAWGYRTPVTISHTQVANTAQTNFPVLVSASLGTWKSAANGGHVAQTSGADILFTASDGLTKLSHEIEQYNPATGQILAWVNVPTVSPTTDTTIYMYYGNASATAQANPPGAWNSNYMMVQHMSDSQASPLTIDDSTSYANFGVKLGSTDPAQTAGEIGYAEEFNAANGDIIRVAPTTIFNTASLPITGNLYWGYQLADGDLLYAASRSANSATTGAVEVDPMTGQVVFSWHDPTWVETTGPECIYKYSNGNYLISTVDAANGVREMTPAGATVWEYAPEYMSDAKPIDLNGTDAVLIFGVEATSVQIIARSNQAVLWQTGGFAQANNGDFRVINGQNYILVADYTLHQIQEINYSTKAVVWSYTYSTPIGPFDAEWIDDDTVLVADGADHAISEVSISTSELLWQSSALDGTTVSAQLTADGQHAIVSDSTAVLKFVNIPQSTTPIVDSLNLPASVTLEAWVEPGASTGTGQFVLDKTGKYALFVSAASGAGVILNNSEVVMGGGVPAGKWSHVVATYDGSTVRIYVNGTLTASEAYSTPLISSGGELDIGSQNSADGPASNFNGSIDEVRVSNVALSPDWISTEFANENSPASFYTVGVETPAP